ncbi:hypothetical protein AB0I60_24810 [Actinosynnema sp. NPDC050436]|uniref:hypothetical protein n=1 Tax=Actinosynnema sp. NPDC050436 TaxID=3155659 RepID=UPI0033E701AA
MTRKVLGVVALAVGALLVFAGSWQELLRLEGPAGPGSAGIALTPWSIENRSGRTRSPNGVDSPQWGYALVLAGGLAAFAAVALVRSPRLAALGRLAAALAVGLVGATAWAAYTTITTLLSGPREPSSRFQWVVGSGLWTLATACLVLLVGAVLALEWPPRAPRPEGPVVYQVDGDDDHTPPFGILLPPTALGAADAPSAADPSPPGPAASTPPVARTGEENPPTGGNPSTVEP